MPSNSAPLNSNQRSSLPGEVLLMPSSDAQTSEESHPKKTRQESESMNRDSELSSVISNNDESYNQDENCCLADSCKTRLIHTKESNHPRSVSDSNSSAETGEIQEDLIDMEEEETGNSDFTSEIERQTPTSEWSGSNDSGSEEEHFVNDEEEASSNPDPSEDQNHFEKSDEGQAGEYDQDQRSDIA